MLLRIRDFFISAKPIRKRWLRSTTVSKPIVDSSGLIAQPGMGKTTMLFHLLETFRSTACIAFLFQTHCNSREFMRLLLAELGAEEDTQDLVRMYDEFNRRLVQIAQEGNRLIVVVDEAQKSRT